MKVRIGSQHSLLFWHAPWLSRASSRQACSCGCFSPVRWRFSANDRRVYRISFRFKTSDGHEYESFVETSITDHIEDQRDEPLVYEASRPSMAVLLDTLPPQVKRLIAPD